VDRTASSAIWTPITVSDTSWNWTWVGYSTPQTIPRWNKMHHLALTWFRYYACASSSSTGALFPPSSGFNPFVAHWALAWLVWKIPFVLSGQPNSIVAPIWTPSGCFIIFCYNIFSHFIWVEYLVLFLKKCFTFGFL